MNKSDAKLSLPALTALVVGSMIGAGIFSLPATFGAQRAGLLPSSRGVSLAGNVNPRPGLSDSGDKKAASGFGYIYLC